MASLKKDEYEVIAVAAAKPEKEAAMAKATTYALQSYIHII